MKESSKVATVFISCLCLMKVPEMNDNSLPAVYIKKIVRSSTRNSVCNSFLLYCLSGIQCYTAIKGVKSTMRVFITRGLNRLPVFFTNL